MDIAHATQDVGEQQMMNSRLRSTTESSKWLKILKKSPDFRISAWAVPVKSF